MKTKTLFCAIVAMLIHAITIAQTVEEEISTFIQKSNYFDQQSKEKIFTHTNKSVYISSETIWLKTYIADNTNNKPFLGTTNVYISLYNPKEELITEKLIYAENGKAIGEIALPEDLESGMYFLQTSTQWSEHYNSNHISPIQIINVNSKEKIIFNTTEIPEKFTLDILPKSGIILADTENTITVKTATNFKNLSLKGEIIKENEVVETFKTDANGLYSFKHLPNKEESYAIRVYHNEEAIQKEIPSSKEIGFLLYPNGEDDDYFYFKIKTNNNTLDQKKGAKYYIISHVGNNATYANQLVLSENSYSFSISIPKKSSLPGLNSLSMFDANDTLVSSISFWKKTNKNIDIQTTINKGKDSSKINLYLRGDSALVSSSISILPKKSKMYQDISTIETAFYIPKTYKHLISNENSLVNNTYTNTQELEKASVVIPRKKEPNTFEMGTSLTGTINYKKDLSNHKILLTSSDNGFFMESKISAPNTFSIDSIFIKHPSYYTLKIISPDNKMINRGYLINAKISHFNPILKLPKKSKNYFQNFYTQYKKQNPENSSFGEVDKLREIVLNQRVDKKEELQEIDLFAKRESVLGSEFVRSHTFKEENFRATPIITVINNLPGIQVKNLDGIRGVTKIHIVSTRGRRTITQGNQHMLLLIDGFQIDAEDIRDRHANEFESEITINATGAGYGVIGYNGVIALRTKKGKLIKGKKNTISKDQQKTNTGFSLPEVYKKSDLYFGNQQSEEKYSEIAWFPNVKIKSNQSNSLRFKNSDIEDFKLILNGMDEDGNIIYKEIELSTKEDN